MLQIPRVFPYVFCLGSAKAVQCSRPGPKFGDKSQQIPRYSRVCPRGQPLGWSLLSALSSSVALQTWATLESRTKQPGWNKSLTVSDRSSVKEILQTTLITFGTTGIRLLLLRKYDWAQPRSQGLFPGLGKGPRSEVGLGWEDFWVALNYKNRMLCWIVKIK